MSRSRTIVAFVLVIVTRCRFCSWNDRIWLSSRSSFTLIFPEWKMTRK